MLVLILNPGSTSTKIAVYDEDGEREKLSIAHDETYLLQFDRIIDQLEYRKGLVLDALKEMGYQMSDFSAICSRGGLLRHIPSGIYMVNDKAVYDMVHALYGEHAANLGILLAKELGDTAGIPSFFMDPPSTDEMADVARVSGYKGMERESFFHALNQKGMAHKAAEQLGRAYEELNWWWCIPAAACPWRPMRRGGGRCVQREGRRGVFHGPCRCPARECPG